MIKKFLLFLMGVLLLVGGTPVFAQQAFLSTNFTATGDNGGIKLSSSGVAYNGATVNVLGTASACTFKMDSSVDGITWNDGDVLGATDCTTNSSTAYTHGTFNYVRIRVTAITVTAGNSVQLTQIGYINNPAGGGGTPGGADTQVQFNDGGSFGSIPESSYNKADHTLKFAYTYTTPPTFMPFEIDATWNNDSSPGDPALIVSSDIETSANTGGTFYGIQAFATVPNSANFPAGGVFAIEANATADTVGKGPSSPTALHAVTVSSENGDFVWGINSEVKGARAGALADVAAIVGVVENGSSGATTLTRALLARSASNTGGGTIANNYGVDIEDQHGVGNTNAALHIADQGTGASDYAIKIDGGKSSLPLINNYIYVDGTKYAYTAAGIQAAINDANSAAGSGVAGTVILPPTVTFGGNQIVLGATGLTLPSSVCLVGAGPNNTILRFNSTIGNAITLAAGTTYACLRDLTLSFSASATSGVGIGISGNSGGGHPTEFNRFSNVHISFDAITGGQVGIKAVGTSQPTDISVNWFDNIEIDNADKPIICTHCEGNQWSNLNIVNWGAAVSQTAFAESDANDERISGRIVANVNQAGVNYATDGVGNIVTLVCDGFVAQTCINDTGSRNMFQYSLIGPTRGTISSTSQVLESNGTNALIITPSINTSTNCASSGGTCGSAASGSVSIAAAATTVTVSTTAVTANSVILLTEDDSLGTKLGVTCNTTLSRVYEISARNAGVSFQITSSVAPSVNPACLNYLIVN